MTTVDQYFIFFFQSISLFMFAFLMIQYLIIGRKEYLFYSIYLLCLFVYYLVALPDFFYGVSLANAEEMTKYDLFKRPLQFMSSVFYTLFVIYYLDIKKLSSYLYRFLRTLIWVYIVLSLITFSLNFAGINYDSIYYVFSLLLFPLQLWIVAALFRHRVQYSYYIIWGSIITLIGSSLTLIYYIYLIKNEPNNPNGNSLSYIPVQVSILIDMFLFTIALQRKIANNEKSLINSAFQRQEAVLLERERIIADLHDDVGGGLSSIRMMSDLMVQKAELEKQDGYINFSKKISHTAKDIAQRMHTIIWSLNAENDTVENFAEYVRQFGITYFENTAIQFKTDIADGLKKGVVVSGVKRKNLFLIVKEAFHNIVKHSGASKVQVQLLFDEKELKISIADNGKGITEETNPPSMRFGNGLKNMQKRMDEINGKIHIQNLPTGGMSIVIQVDIV